VELIDRVSGPKSLEPPVVSLVMDTGSDALWPLKRVLKTRDWLATTMEVVE